MNVLSSMRQGVLKAPADWAVSQPWIREWMADLGIRPIGHSTLLWFKEGPGDHTRVTLRNYFSLNYGIPNPTYSFVLHDADGTKVVHWEHTAGPDETLVIDSAEVVRRFRLGQLFEGNLAVEVQHPKLHPPRFLRVNVDYYNDEGLISTVHDQGRLVKSPRPDAQSLVYVREDAEYETGVALQNWFRYKRRPSEFMAEATIELLNAAGESRAASIEPIPACGTRYVRVADLFPGAAAFLAGEPGGLRIHSTIAMGRSIPVVKSRRTGLYAVSHTVGDHDPSVYSRDLIKCSAIGVDEWAPVWCTFVEENDAVQSEYSFFNNWLPRNTYTLDVRIFDDGGRLRALVPQAMTLRPMETRIFRMAELLPVHGIAIPFRGTIEARIVPRTDQDEMPGPGMLQANTIWRTPGGMTQSNNQSFGHLNSPRAVGNLLSPKRTKMFGRVIATDRYETMMSLMNPSSEVGYEGVSDTELLVCDASGTKRQSQRLRIPPHGSIWVNLSEVFPNLEEFLEGSRGISSVVVADRTAKLTGYLGVRDKQHGTMGIDHLFGG